MSARAVPLKQGIRAASKEVPSFTNTSQEHSLLAADERETRINADKAGV